MKKIALLMIVCVMYLITGTQVFAYDKLDEPYIVKDFLLGSGYSPYLCNIAALQEKKHNGLLTKSDFPKTGDVWMTNIIYGDLLLPTQAFGYYYITEKD